MDGVGEAVPRTAGFRGGKIVRFPQICLAAVRHSERRARKSQKSKVKSQKL
ncbi:MAG: hypothetical protein ACRC2R_15960 [Xenococcaceae cyanobacterium]